MKRQRIQFNLKQIQFSRGTYEENITTPTLNILAEQCASDSCYSYHLHSLIFQDKLSNQFLSLFRLVFRVSETKLPYQFFFALFISRNAKQYTFVTGYMYKSCLQQKSVNIFFSLARSLTRSLACAFVHSIVRLFL